ncbi:SurA N-terminal domain-containing protein [Litorimonas haliclonae]|uniref:SurA N-terminal domain-containing protein n=1 Tax=Litorimonas haliclonae TaxID=2081977 RepID=UPI0039EF2C36
MAESIGGKIRNVLVGILIGMLVLAFAVWGVNDMFTPGARNAVATVGDTEISTAEFDTLFSRELERINSERPESLTNQQAYDQGLQNQVLQGMITNAVVKIDADDLGVGVNQSIARREIENIPAFQNELTGKFDENKLNQALNRARITREQFENDTLSSLRSQQTIPAITGGLVAPADYAALQYKFLTEQRRASVLTLSQNAVAEPEIPSDEVLKSYIDDNAARYMAPEYRRFSLIRVEPFDYTEDLEIEPEQVKESFDYRVSTGTIGSPETRSVALITTADEETAKEAVAQLQTGTEPELVASSLGLDAPDVYENVRRNGLVDPATSTAAFELSKGDARAVLGGLGSWNAVYVQDITPAVVPDFEASKDEIEQELLEAKALDAIYDLTADIEDARLDNLPLIEIAEQVNVPMSEYPFVDRRGTTQDGIRMGGFSAIPGIAADDKILRTLFTSDLGYETDLFETSTGGYAMIRVDDIIDSTMRPFEEVREQALTAYQNQQRSDALRSKATELTQRVRDGESLQALKDELGEAADISQTGLVRTNPPQFLGPQVTVGLFDGRVGDVVRGPGPDQMTQQIAKLESITASQDGLAGTYLDVLQQQATSAISNDIQNAYQSAIIKKNPVQQYPNQIRSVLGLTTEN